MRLERRPPHLPRQPRTHSAQGETGERPNCRAECSFSRSTGGGTRQGGLQRARVTRLARRFGWWNRSDSLTVLVERKDLARMDRPAFIGAVGD